MVALDWRDPVPPEVPGSGRLPLESVVAPPPSARWLVQRSRPAPALLGPQAAMAGAAPVARGEVLWALAWAS